MATDVTCVAVAEEPDSSWKYRTWRQLDGYPYWGQMATYSGGGYVARLGRSNASAQAVIDELMEHAYVRFPRQIGLQISILI